MIVALLALALTAPAAAGSRRGFYVSVYGRSARARQQALSIVDDLRISPSKRG